MISLMHNGSLDPRPAAYLNLTEEVRKAVGTVISSIFYKLAFITRLNPVIH